MTTLYDRWGAAKPGHTRRPVAGEWDDPTWITVEATHTVADYMQPEVKTDRYDCFPGLAGQLAKERERYGVCSCLAARSVDGDRLCVSCGRLLPERAWAEVAA